MEHCCIHHAGNSITLLPQPGGLDLYHNMMLNYINGGLHFWLFDDNKRHNIKLENEIKN